MFQSFDTLFFRSLSLSSWLEGLHYLSTSRQCVWVVFFPFFWPYHKKTHEPMQRPEGRQMNANT